MRGRWGQRAPPSRWLLPLASLLLPWAAATPAPLAPPALAVQPQHQLFYEGEEVTLTCSAPAPPRGDIRTFRFLRPDGGDTDLPARPLFPPPRGLLRLRANRSSQGTYTCLYLLGEPGGDTWSNRSRPLVLQVQAAPPAPTFSLVPQQLLYHPGQQVQLFCSVPPSSQHLLAQVQFFSTLGLAITSTISTRTPRQRNQSHPHALPARELRGSYGCSYFLLLSGRLVGSRRSPWVQVHVGGPRSCGVREALVGGAFVTINGLIFLTSRLLGRRSEDPAPAAAPPAPPAAPREGPQGPPPAGKAPPGSPAP